MTTDDLAALLAKRFIQRRDVKAVQFDNGAYSPDRELKHLGNYGPLGFKMPHLRAHLAGDQTYGHYLLDKEDKCRLFAFDIDLEKTGSWVDAWELGELSVHECNPREIWAKRWELSARKWYKYQFMMLAHKLTKGIQELGIQTASAYSGSKGIHVYGFTGEMPAKEVREGAMLVLDMIDEFEPHRGQVMFKHKNPDPHQGFPSMTIEVFPKQDSLDGKDLGNLMRLPLGKNRKSQDPTFFLDMTGPVGVMKPHPDPVSLLTSGDPYAE